VNRICRRAFAPGFDCIVSQTVFVHQLSIGNGPKRHGCRRRRTGELARFRRDNPLKRLTDTLGQCHLDGLQAGTSGKDENLVND
jgi:hypothetical protein